MQPTTVDKSISCVIFHSSVINCYLQVRESQNTDIWQRFHPPLTEEANLANWWKEIGTLLENRKSAPAQ